jgi:beta-lactamase regulating signal transducer with metallopeptidase domain
MTASEILVHGLEATFWFSLLVLLVLALRSEVARRFGPRAAMLLWALPGLRLFAPTLTRTETVILSSDARTHGHEGAVPRGQEIEPAFSHPVPEPLPTPVATGTSASDPAPSAYDMMSHAVLKSEEPAQAINGPWWEGALSLLSTDVIAALVLSLWFAGAALALLLCILRSAEWRKTVLAELAETPGATDRLTQAAATRVGTKRAFTLVTSRAVSAPQLMGLRSPVLALPTDFAERYSREEQEMALLHELTHLKRCDLLVLAVSEFAFACQWFNPLTRHARKALRSDQEAACDEAVRDLGISTRSYAELLLKSVRGSKPVPALTLDSHLKERIVRMQNPTQGPLKRALFITASCGAALCVAAFTASSTTRTAFVQEEGGEPTPWETFAEGLKDSSADRGDGERSRRNASSAGNARILSVSGDGQRPDVFVIRLTEDGDVLNEQALERFAERNGIEIDVSAGRDGEPAFSFDTRGKNIEIRRLTETDREQFQNRLERAQERRVRIHALHADRQERRARLEERSDEGEESHFEFHYDDGDGEDSGERGRVRLRSSGEGSEERLGELTGLLNEMEGRMLIIHGDDEGSVFTFDGDQLREQMGRQFGFLSGDNSLGSLLNMDDTMMTGWVSPDGDEPTMILLGNPFADLEAPGLTPPTPPAPKAPKAPKLKERKTEEGTWILIPDAPDMSEFEASMEAFEGKMEAWGEKMEEWGERMEERGELIGSLTEDCEAHIEKTDEPTVLSVRIPGSRERVRGLCASGGKDRLASEELQRFVERANLSDEERSVYRRTIKD